MDGTNNINRDITEKRQRILKMIKEYWDKEDKNLEREEILNYDENVEKVYTIFSTKEKSDRDIIIEKYKEEAQKEYLEQRTIIYKLIWEAKKLVMKYEEMRQNKNDQDDIENIEDILSTM